ncbi:MAG TPA: hypothetical protein VGM14_19870 [Streptosporangiaceae bacterium]
MSLAAQVVAGPFGDLVEPVVGGVDVQMQPLGRDLGVQVGLGVGHQRRDQRAAGCQVLGDEAPDLGPDQPLGRLGLAEDQVVEGGEQRQREHAASGAERLPGDLRLGVRLRYLVQAVVHGADANRQPGLATAGLPLACDDLRRLGVAERDHADDFVLPPGGQPGCARRRERRHLVAGRRGRGHDQSGLRSEAGRPQDRALLPGEVRPVSEQVLDQIPAEPIVLGEPVLLRLDVGFGRDRAA